MRWIGRLSYSWYLWHWPFIVLAVLAVGNSSVSLRTGAALVSLGVAYVAFRTVENPLRFNQSLIRSSRRTFLIGFGDHGGHAWDGGCDMGVGDSEYAGLLRGASICCNAGFPSKVFARSHSAGHPLLCRRRPEQFYCGGTRR